MVKLLVLALLVMLITLHRQQPDREGAQRGDERGSCGR